MPSTRYYVRIDRADGSRTYKGPWIWDHAKKERDAWRGAFPDYRSEVMPIDSVLVADVRKWKKATKVSGPNARPRRYFPEPAPSSEASPEQVRGMFSGFGWNVTNP